jgi:hypothetical protein
LTRRRLEQPVREWLVDRLDDEFMPRARGRLTDLLG